MRLFSGIPLFIGLSLAAHHLYGAEFENLAPKAQAFRQGAPVTAQPGNMIVAEAEEFQPSEPEAQARGTSWKAGNWGENYYAATMANTFLSRKAFLGAPEQCATQQTASIIVDMPKAGRYLALVRYEAAFRFETQFKLRIEQAGQTKLDRLYGARDNIKIWAFKGAGQGTLTKEVGWSWGAVENIVWEGHDAAVELDVGRATLTLITDKQPEPAARRNVDLVMLAGDEADIKNRIEKENYLPLDGLLTQSGDVFMRITNSGSDPITITAGACVEHSPYWIHLRAWKPVKFDVPVSTTTEWIEVGGLLDSLNDGAWSVASTATPPSPPLEGGAKGGWTAEFAVRTPDGKLESIAKFETKAAKLDLAYDANTRYSRRIRLVEDVLYDLLGYLKKQPTPGEPPQRTIVYGGIFDPRPDDPRYTAARAEFAQMFNIQLLDNPNRRPTDAIDVRDDPKLEEHLQKIAQSEKGDKIRVVSLGDEIGLSAPSANVNDMFHAWAKARGLQPAEVDPAAGEDWAKVTFGADAALAESNPHRYYYSKLYTYQFGIETLKRQTDLIKHYLPRADAGANYSPHGEAPYLGTAHQWISVFRRGGMTLPWGEDYTWQVPVATQQMTMILLDLLRAGNRYHPERDILLYVMPHWPGNTVKSWRRSFYGAVGHGATIIHLFEFRPVQTAYTENHTSLPEMFQEVRKSLAELAKFEDIVQDGRVHKGEAALWYSETSDVWDNHRVPFGAGKRTLYIAARHQQLGVDVVDEEDALKGTLKEYAILYLTDPNVSRAATRAIAEWAKQGGRLFVTAGGGMLDEFNEPNTAMQELLGVKQTSLEFSSGIAIRFDKQDLPFAAAIEAVRVSDATIPAFGAISRVAVAKDVDVAGKFTDDSPALTRRAVGKGTATYCGFLPGLSYFKPAIPKRPVDRGSTDDAMAHFLPTQFDAAAGTVIGEPAKGVAITVRTNIPTVEATLIESTMGSAIMLVNWSGAPVKNLTVSLRGPVKAISVTRASGDEVSKPKVQDDLATFTLDTLDVADALIVR